VVGRHVSEQCFCRFHDGSRAFEFDLKLDDAVTTLIGYTVTLITLGFGTQGMVVVPLALFAQHVAVTPHGFEFGAQVCGIALSGREHVSEHSMFGSVECQLW
jgi:hypothetical protein